MHSSVLRARLRAATEPPRPPQGTMSAPSRATISEVEPPSVGAPLAGDDGLVLASPTLVPAAVLIGLVLGREPSVLLTKRTAHLAKHGGQVSFPGGRIDPTDASPEHAALREAEEEVGLAPALVELVGRLSDYVTGTGYRITPVLGLLPEGHEFEALNLRPSPDEVADVFVLPLSVVLDPAAPQRQRAHFRGAWREFWVWPHPDHYIWGATAAMLVHLAARLRTEA